MYTFGYTEFYTWVRGVNIGYIAGVALEILLWVYRFKCIALMKP